MIQASHFGPTLPHRGFLVGFVVFRDLERFLLHGLENTTGALLEFV